MNETASPGAAPSAALTIITGRLPYLDRRALSEAWFSALHLASGSALGESDGRRLRHGTAASASAGGVARHTPQSVPHAPLAAPHRPLRGEALRATAPSASWPAARAAAKERTACERARNHPPFRASLVVGVDKHRVQLLLRREGGTVHVVALCRPEVADVVRRALACADAQAFARGEAIRSAVQPLPAGVVRA